MSCRVSAVVCALALAAAASSARAQSPQPTPPQQQPSPVPGTFKSRVTLIPLDVRVLDQRGRPVTDLEQNDFVVFEEDVPQRIGHFSRNVLTVTSTSADEPLLMRQAPGGELTPQNRRIFLLVLGRGRLQYPARGVDAAISFVRSRLLPQDQVAVLAYNRATDFTTDHASIVRVLERYRERHEVIEAELQHRISGFEAVSGSRAIPNNMQARIDELFSGVESPAFRQIPPGRIDLESIGVDPVIGFRIGDPFDMASFERFVTYNVQTLHDMGNLYGGIEYLRYLEGEKHLVFLTEHGVFLPAVDDDLWLADVASDARVVIDIIKTGGVYADPPGRRWLSNIAWAHTFSWMAVQNISRYSGGQSSLFRYADKAFARIDEATRSSYLIGYYPSNPDWDGSFRRIKVKVNRPGVTVLVRHGYFAREQLVPFDRRRFLTYSRVISAGGYPKDMTDIGVKLDATMAKRSAGGGEAIVNARIDPSRIAFTESDGHHVATLDVAVYCGDKGGRTLCEQWEKAELKLTPDALERARKDSIPYSMRIPLKAEPRYVKVVVYDYGADVLGSATVTVK